MKKQNFKPLFLKNVQKTSPWTMRRSVRRGGASHTTPDNVVEDCTQDRRLVAYLGFLFSNSFFILFFSLLIHYVT